MTDYSVRITVHYERKLSDGQYGSEGVSLEWTGPHQQAYQDVASALRVQVLSFLASSTAEQVAYAARRELNLAASHAAIPVDEQALAAAEYELQAGLRDNARLGQDPEEEESF